MARDLTSVAHLVSRTERESRAGHRACVVWLTGLSGAGKSTLAMLAERDLFSRGRLVYVLDGDNVRSGLSSDLSFSPQDRVENIRRVSELAALLAEAGFVVISAFISPYARDREFARSRFPANFHEIYVRCPLEICEARDPKGLYAKARKGRISDFTGVTAPYESPETPDLVLDTEDLAPAASASALVSYIESRIGNAGL